MKFKMIIVDLDGTVVDSPKQKVASGRIKESVLKLDELGIKVCAATGRSLSFARPVVDSMGLSYDNVIAGGSRIFNYRSNELVWQALLTNDQLEQIVKLFSNTEYGFLWNDSTEDDYLSGGWPLAKLKMEEDIYFFEICFLPSGEVDAIVDGLKKIKGIAVSVVVAQRPGTNDIHVTNIHATKEHAVAELLAKYRIDKSEVIGVGDGHNDINLFNSVGYKVAMGNSVPELKDRADRIIGSVKEDGLADYFEEIIKLNRGGII